MAGVNIALISSTAVQEVAIADTVKQVQNGIDQHVSPVTGDMNRLIESLKQTEDQRPELRARLLKESSAVQSLVDYQVKTDKLGSAMASGAELQTALDAHATGAALTPDITKLVEDIQKKEVADPFITKDMQAKYPGVQAAVDKVNNKPAAMASGGALQTAIDKQGGPDGPVTDEMKKMAEDIQKREAQDPSITAEMWNKHPDVQKVVDKVNNKPAALLAGQQLQAATHSQALGAPPTDKMMGYAKDIQKREAADPSIRAEMLSKSPDAQGIVDKLNNNDSALAAAAELNKTIKGYSSEHITTSKEKRLAEEIRMRETNNPGLTAEIRQKYPDLQVFVDHLPKA